MGGGRRCRRARVSARERARAGARGRAKLSGGLLHSMVTHATGREKPAGDGVRAGAPGAASERERWGRRQSGSASDGASFAGTFAAHPEGARGRPHGDKVPVLRNDARSSGLGEAGFTRRGGVARRLIAGRWGGALRACAVQTATSTVSALPCPYKF